MRGRRKREGGAQTQNSTRESDQYVTTYRRAMLGASSALLLRSTLEVVAKPLSGGARVNSWAVPCISNTLAVGAKDREVSITNNGGRALVEVAHASAVETAVWSQQRAAVLGFA